MERKLSAPLKPMLATSSGADVPPTAHRGRQLLHDGKTTLPTLNPERCQPYRPRPVPAAAPGTHRSTTPKTGAHAAAWHAPVPGATWSLPAPLPHYNEPTLGPFTATTKDVPDATLPRAALCHIEHAGLFRPGASHSARHTVSARPNRSRYLQHRPPLT